MTLRIMPLNITSQNTILSIAFKYTTPSTVNIKHIIEKHNTQFNIEK